MSNDPREITRELLKPKGFPDPRPSPQRRLGGARPSGLRPSRRTLFLCGLSCISGLAVLTWPQRLPEVPGLTPGPARQEQAPVPASQEPQPTPARPATQVPDIALRRGVELLGAAPGGDWRVARLAEHPAILIIEFPDLETQGAALNRLAALIEKRGAPRDRVLKPEELALLLHRRGDSAATFYQGHDYLDSSLARFYAQVARQGLTLNPDEERLRITLQGAGLLSPSAPASSVTGQFVAPQALIAFTAVQPDDPATLADEEVDPRRRETVLRHELSHGFFFTHADYQKQVLEFWRKALSESERKAFVVFLGGLDYDTENETLMANETQAFLMHTPDPRVFSAVHLGWSENRLTDLRARFRQLVPALQAVSFW